MDADKIKIDLNGRIVTVTKGKYISAKTLDLKQKRKYLCVS